MPFAEPETNPLFLPYPDPPISVKNPEGLNRQKIQPLSIPILEIRFTTITRIAFVRFFEGSTGIQPTGQVTVTTTTTWTPSEIVTGWQTRSLFPATPVPRMVVATRTRFPASEGVAGLTAQWVLDAIPWVDSVGSLTLSSTALDIDDFTGLEVVVPFNGVNVGTSGGDSYAEFGWYYDEWNTLNATFNVQENRLECDGSTLQVINSGSLHGFKLEFDLYHQITSSFYANIMLENQFYIKVTDSYLIFEDGNQSYVMDGTFQGDAEWFSHRVEYDPTTNDITFTITAGVPPVGIPSIVTFNTGAHLPYVAPAGRFMLAFRDPATLGYDDNLGVSTLPPTFAHRIKNVKFYKFASVPRI